MKGLLLCSLLSLTVASPVPEKRPSDGLQIHALLIAGSNGIQNYRHQADLAHSYHLLLDKGVPAGNIVVMMYDDIANNPSNPTPGQLRNSPNGPDYYKGLKIDYRLTDVNVDNFVAVLTGNAKNVKGQHNTGRVLKSTAADNVFLYYVDHGGVGIVGMPSGRTLTKSTLQNAIKKAKYNQMAVYIESCESGSMLQGMENWTNVFGLTASTASQSSWACNCAGGTCYGDEFSVQWMTDSEKHNLNKLDLVNQFTDVKADVKSSTVCRFGNQILNPFPVSHFQGEKEGIKIAEDFNLNGPGTTVPARDVPLYYYSTIMTSAGSQEEREEAREELEQILWKRTVADGLLQGILDHLAVKVPQNGVEAGPDCYEQLIETFEEHCQLLGQSPYLAGKMGRLQGLVEGRECSELVGRLGAFCQETRLFGGENGYFI